MPIPDGLNRDDIISAMDRLGPDESEWPKARKSRYYDVIHPDPIKRWHMPPKLVISEAVRTAFGFSLPPDQFSGGNETNRYLAKLDLEIIDRRRA